MHTHTPNHATTREETGQGKGQATWRRNMDALQEQWSSRRRRSAGSVTVRCSDCCHCPSHHHAPSSMHTVDRHSDSCTHTIDCRSHLDSLSIVALGRSSQRRSLSSPLHSSASASAFAFSSAFAMGNSKSQHMLAEHQRKIAWAMPSYCIDKVQTDRGRMSGNGARRSPFDRSATSGGSPRSPLCRPGHRVASLCCVCASV